MIFYPEASTFQFRGYFLGKVTIQAAWIGHFSVIVAAMDGNYKITRAYQAEALRFIKVAGCNVQRIIPILLFSFKAIIRIILTSYRSAY